MTSGTERRREPGTTQMFAVDTAIRVHPQRDRRASTVIRVHQAHEFPDGLPSPDVYFTQPYGRAASISDGGEWVLLEALDGNWQVPLILRTLNTGVTDAISPYGYSGVYASPALTSLQVADAWSATLNCLRQLGVISVLLRHSPLVHQAADLPGLITIMSGHPTIVIEPIDTESAWNALEKRCRTKIRKALKHGFTGHVRQAGSQDLAPGGNFRRLYEGTMRRLDAASLYYFSDEYYTALLDGLGSDLLIAEVADPQGVVSSASLLMRHADRIHGHLAGSNAADAGMGTNNLLKWVTIEFALDQGLRQFHLGGGVGSRDNNLFKFKRSFGGRELEYRVSGLIIDEGAYQTQVKDRATECDTTAETLLTSSFFPAYRGGEE